MAGTIIVPMFSLPFGGVAAFQANRIGVMHLTMMNYEFYKLAGPEPWDPTGKDMSVITSEE